MIDEILVSFEVWVVVRAVVIFDIKNKSHFSSLTHWPKFYICEWIEESFKTSFTNLNITSIEIWLDLFTQIAVPNTFRNLKTTSETITSAFKPLNLEQHRRFDAV